MRTKPYTEAELKKKTKAELADILRDINKPVFGGMLSLSNVDEPDLIRKILEEQAASSGSTGPVPAPSGTPTSTSPSTSGGDSTTSSTSGGTSVNPADYVQCPHCVGSVMVKTSDFGTHLMSVHPDKLGITPTTAASPASPATPPSGGTTATATTPATPAAGATTSNQVVAPNLRGMTVVEARKALWGMGLELDMARSLHTYDKYAEANSITDQRPAPGQPVDPNKKFVIEINDEPAPPTETKTNQPTEPIPAPLPDISSGSTVAWAQSTLRTHGFTTFGSISEPDPLVRKGRVIRVEPDSANPKRAVLVLSEGNPSNGGLKGWFENWVHNE